jgi:hypothetical protein
MTAPEKMEEIKGEKVSIYGYTAYVVKRVSLAVDEKGLHVKPVVYVVVEYPGDPKGCYRYVIEEGSERVYDWYSETSIAEMYREIKDAMDALYTMVREKLAAFGALRDLLEKDGIVVDARCWGYYKLKEDVIKELQ